MFAEGHRSVTVAFLARALVCAHVCPWSRWIRSSKTSEVKSRGSRGAWPSAEAVVPPGAPSGSPCDQGVGAEAGPRPSLSPLPPCPGVHIQSSQIVESSGLYTLQSVLKAQLVKEDKDAQFYCELNYRLPSGNHMKESREVVVPVFCESRYSPGLGRVGKSGRSPARGRLMG